MKNSTLLFMLKCAVIIYAVAFTGKPKLTQGTLITPTVTKGSWKVNCSSESAASCMFEGYTFTFNKNSKLTAVKNGILVNGHWLEDNISNTITISFKNTNAVLHQLNDYWLVTEIKDGNISFEKKNRTIEKIYFTAL
jgi:hypothetical protein